MMSYEVKYEDDEDGGRDESGFGVSELTDSQLMRIDPDMPKKRGRRKRVQNTIKDCEGDDLAMRTFQSKIGTVVVHDRSRLGKMGRGRSLCRPSDGLNPENQV